MKRFLTISATVSSLVLLPAVAGASTSVVNNVSATASSGAGTSSAHVEATTVIDGKTVAQEEYFEEVTGGASASASVESEVTVHEQGESVTPTYAEESDTPAASPSVSTSSATSPTPERTEGPSQNPQETAAAPVLNEGNEEQGTVVEKIVSALRNGIETVTSKVYHALTAIFA